MRLACRCLLAFALALPASACLWETNPLYCDEATPCSDPALPRCDLVAHQCYPAGDGGAADAAGDARVDGAADGPLPQSDAAGDAVAEDATQHDAMPQDDAPQDASGSDASCGAGSCPGGCCSGLTCIPHASQSAATCGTGGADCRSCGAGQVCNGVGQCVCTPSSCPGGCCDGNACIPYASQSAAHCGTGGATCGACATGQACGGAGECVCTPTSCANGCCNGSTCVLYADQSGSTCGNAGVACGACAGMTLVCSGGSCVGPSCAGLAADCGPSGSATCCATSLVPGGTYDRSNDASYPATVSDFKLDVYEVTVGRFRAFVSAGKGTQGTPPAAASGANPNLAGSGWQAAWNTSLVANTNALKAAIKCNATYQTWTDSPAGNEDRPMNCITWYEAFAFCIWDGGRLPTEAEWNYVAAGGDEQRLYPWGATAPDDTYAVYCGGSCASTQNVGAKSPKGDGKWGHADLAGNVNEWALDWSATPYPMPCSNCGVVTSGAARVQRGGSFQMNESVLPTSPRGCGDPTNRNQNLGARCARSP